MTPGNRAGRLRRGTMIAGLLAMLVSLVSLLSLPGLASADPGSTPVPEPSSAAPTSPSTSSSASPISPSRTPHPATRAPSVSADRSTTSSPEAMPSATDTPSAAVESAEETVGTLAEVTTRGVLRDARNGAPIPVPASAIIHAYPRQLPDTPTCRVTAPGRSRPTTPRETSAWRSTWSRPKRLQLRRPVIRRLRAVVVSESAV